jgi:hypothetical protein
VLSVKDTDVDALDWVAKEYRLAYEAMDAVVADIKAAASGTTRPVLPPEAASDNDDLTEGATPLAGSSMVTASRANKPPVDNRFERAEERLKLAEERLRSWVDAPEYKSFKRSVTVLAAFAIGLLVAIAGELYALNAIGIRIPRLVDMVITGLIIGAGPGPTHDILRILQGAKDALTNVATLARARAKEEVDKVNAGGASA